MSVLIFLFFVFSIIAAGIMEAVKKGLYGVRHDKGVKTSMPVWAIRLTAVLVALVEACLMAAADRFTGLGWYMLPGWMLLLYIGQYVIDMGVVKRAVNAIIERIRG